MRVRSKCGRDSKNVTVWEMLSSSRHMEPRDRWGQWWGKSPRLVGAFSPPSALTQSQHGSRLPPRQDVQSADTAAGCTRFSAAATRVARRLLRDDPYRARSRKATG